VSVPAGVVQGTVLRLAGLGKQMPDGEKGDLLLRVTIQEV